MPAGALLAYFVVARSPRKTRNNHPQIHAFFHRSLISPQSNASPGKATDWPLKAGSAAILPMLGSG